MHIDRERTSVDLHGDDARSRTERDVVVACPGVEGEGRHVDVRDVDGGSRGAAVDGDRPADARIELQVEDEAAAPKDAEIVVRLADPPIAARIQAGGGFRPRVVDASVIQPGAEVSAI